jgi:iron complex outermembrane recepter protein
MSRMKRLLSFGLCASMIATAGMAFAQTQHPQTWAQDIAYMQNLTPSEAAAQQSTILQIRSEVELWLKAHPRNSIQLAPLPPQPLTAEQTADQIKELDRVIAEIIKRDPNHPFHLGTVQVNVTASASELSPITDIIDQTEMAKRNVTNAAMAMENMPGVSIQHTYGGRNQLEIYVHGFNYLQVPLYVDGIPSYVPYDGTMDFKQISTTDIAMIQIDKGFSSALMGPNTAGGAINIVSKEPQKKYEGDIQVGGFSGDGFLSSVRLGTRMPHYFVQGAMDWLQNEYTPLSGNFVKNTLQPNNRLNHSYEQNAKYSGRVGWTPKGSNEYVFSYYLLKASQGIPLNPGNDPLTGTGCGAGATASTCYSTSSYRSWGYWDMSGYNFHSNTALGKDSSIKVRAFYNNYPNQMLFYTKLPYITANLNPSPGYITSYKDHSHGASAEFNTSLVKRNVIGASFLFKDDTHKAVPMFPYSYAKAPAYGLDRQQILSIGVQDIITITSHLTVTAGFSADHLDGLRASNDNAQYLNGVAPVVKSGNSTYYAFTAAESTCTTNTSLTNYTACTPHQWGYNPQISASYTFSDSGRLFGGFSQKSRFPGMKELFTYGMNSAIPNPNLKTEHSQNWEIGYSRLFAKKTSAQVNYFYSKLKDAIESITVPSPDNICKNTTSTCSQNVNATKETHQGVEIAVRSMPLPRLTLDANYTYLDKEIDGYTFASTLSSSYPCGGGLLLTGTGSNVTYTTIANNTCLTATGMPKHKAVAAATVQLPHKAVLTADVRYESGTKAVDNYKHTIGTTSNSYYEIVPLSNFGIVGLGGTVPLYKGAAIQAGVKNLFDRNYYYVLDYPEEGRNWFVNMRYRF